MNVRTTITRSLFTEWDGHWHGFKVWACGLIGHRHMRKMNRVICRRCRIVLY